MAVLVWLCFQLPRVSAFEAFLLWCSGMLANEEGLPDAIEYSHSQRPDNSNKTFSWYAFFFFSVSFEFKISNLPDMRYSSNESLVKRRHFNRLITKMPKVIFEVTA